MRVQFDLRPAGLVEKERKKSGFNLTRIVVMLLFLLFVLSSGYYIWHMWMKMSDLTYSIEDKEIELATLEELQIKQRAEVKRLQDEEKQYISTLKIMQDDLATLEVLNALETNMEWGIGLNSIRMTSTPNAQNVNQYAAVITATAAEEEQIIHLTDGLAGSGVFSSVNMPSSVRDEKTGRINFTLNLSILPIAQINPQGN